MSNFFFFFLLVGVNRMKEKRKYFVNNNLIDVVFFAENIYNERKKKRYNFKLIHVLFFFFFFFAICLVFLFFSLFNSIISVTGDDTNSTSDTKAQNMVYCFTHSFMRDVCKRRMLQQQRDKMKKMVCLIILIDWFFLFVLNISIWRIFMI